MPTDGLTAVIVVVVIGKTDWISNNNGLASNPFAVLSVDATQGLAVEIGDSWIGKTCAETV